MPQKAVKAQWKLLLTTSAIVAASKRAERRWLFRAGRYLMTVARNSLKRGPGGSRQLARGKNGRFLSGVYLPRPGSPPGRPPYSPTRRLKNAVQFYVDIANGRVYIGPTASAVGKIGATHEFGGVESAKKSRKRKNNFQIRIGGHGPITRADGSTGFAKLRTQRQVNNSRRTARALPVGVTQAKGRRRYPARPFMKPALDKANSEGRLSQLWREESAKAFGG